MKKILITGFSGFVSEHFLNYLDENNIKAKILGVDINPVETEYSSFENIKIDFVQLDLLETKKFKDVMSKFNPEYILHLASYSSVGFSWKNPSLSFQNNMDIFLNVMEVVRETCPSCRILSIGSSEQYGNVTKDKIPLKEGYSLNPINPYAVARVAQENLSKVYCDGYGLDIVMTRSFNHIGPGQKDIFVISSFAKQLVDIKNGINKEAKLVTGDRKIIRDFLDVRDVVDAYYKLLVEGIKGEVYNVCSGKGISLQNIIEMMCEILDIEISLETDPNLLRPNDNRIIIGSNNKLKKTIDWDIKIPLMKSLEDVINYWQKKVII